MSEKLYGSVPPYGKSYYAEKVEELYCKLVKQSIDATVGVVDNYIEYWSDEFVQEFNYDVSPLEVLKELKKTLITGQYPDRMMGGEE